MCKHCFFIVEGNCGDRIVKFEEIHLLEYFTRISQNRLSEVGKSVKIIG